MSEQVHHVPLSDVPPKNALTLGCPPLREPWGGVTGRRAAVLGSPVSHSRSPDLHLAAYRALGLTDWTYTRIETTAETLPRIVGSASEDYVGFSVTMPGKRAALDIADERTDRAVLVGSANTLVRTEGGWRADCTDIDGMTGALSRLGLTGAHLGAEVSATAVVAGAGGTALPTVAALAAIGITELTVIARSAARAADVVALAQRLGMSTTVMPFAADPELGRRCAEAAVAVSTVPAAGTEPVLADLSRCRRVVDVIYAPWPTPLADAVARAGGELVGGLVMLINQAFSQVEQFTGRRAPREAMMRVLSGDDRTNSAI